MGTPPRIRLSSSERRESLVEAARTEFSKHGYHGASTVRIATAAGCSEPMLYKHFASKQMLFVAVLDEVGAVMEARIDAVLGQPGDPFDHWYQALEALFSTAAYAEMVSMRMLAVTVAEIPEVAAALVAANERMFERTREAVERATQLGSIAPGTSPEYVTWMWHGLTMVAAARMRADRAPNMAAAVPYAQQFVESLRA